MSNYPEKFTIPKDRIPHAFPQGAIGACVACSITKVLEVINYVKTGEYIELSKGYVYGRHNAPWKKKEGMDYDHAFNSLLERGSVPAEMCTLYDEMPDIRDKVYALENFAELEKVAENTKIKAWEKIVGNIYKFENIKKYLYEHQIPLVGHKSGKTPHCVVICGWDGEKLLYQDHDVTGKVRPLSHKNITYAFYLDGGIEKTEPIPEEPAEETKQDTTAKEVQEESNMAYKLMEVKDFKSYLGSLKITRKITVVQLHHTYSPAYAQFNGANHIKLQQGMRDYHVNTKGYADIAQTFTIFPDGKICTGRDINTAPAGIYGANSTGICIECVGNFDKGGDTMTDAQKNAIVGAVKILVDKFGLNAKTGITYHAWWTSGGTNLGTYIAGRSTKTCPGTNFFGGNTRQAYEKNLLPLIESYGKEVKSNMLETPNDITWELNHRYFPIEDMAGFVKVLDEAKKNNSPLYWGYYKLVNRIK